MKIFLFAIILLFVLVNSQVIGIDFGTEFWKASLISPGKNLVIVENSRSGRKTLNAVFIYFNLDGLSRRCPLFLRRCTI
jgi:hypoxia up-regulated 1